MIIMLLVQLLLCPKGSRFMMTSNATLIGSISGGDQSSAAIYYLVVALTPYPKRYSALIISTRLRCLEHIILYFGAVFC